MRVRFVRPFCGGLAFCAWLGVAPFHATAAGGQTAEPPLEWGRFHDPRAVAVLTAPFAKRIAGLPRAQKAAAIMRLKAALNHPHVEVRRRAALTLGALGDASGVPVMIRDLAPAATPNDNGRGNVSVALRILKDRRALPALKRALRDRSPYIRGIALAALGEMKDQEAFAEIASHLGDKAHEGGCIPMFPAHSACYALGALGDERAIPLLIAALDDKDLTTQAAQALGALTGQTFGYDAAAWKRWWQEQAQTR